MKKPKTSKQSTTSKKSPRKIGEDDLQQVSGGLARRRFGAERSIKVTGGQISNTGWDLTGNKAT